MNNNLKLILIILVTFAVAITTSLLLEIPLFKHWVRQTVIILLILVELYLGFVTFQSIYKE